MKTFAFYCALQHYFVKGEFDTTVGSRDRVRLRQASLNFVLKNNRLYYTGPSRRYMRLVVLSEAEKRSVLMECHNIEGTGNHSGVRSTRDKVIAGYYWPTLIKDVTDWVKCCHRCQQKNSVRTGLTVSRSIKVYEAWEVLVLDLIGPLPETARHNIYVLTLTDLHTKWVIAEPLQSKTVSEVALAIITKLYMFGMVKKIITDQSKEFVNELNNCVFQMMSINCAVSSSRHPQTSGQDEWTNQNIKRALGKYLNDSHHDWDLHLPAVVYAMNTAKQNASRYSPYFLLFHRNPRLPDVMKTPPMGHDCDVADPEYDIDTKVNEMKILHEKVLRKIERAQSRHHKTFTGQKRKCTTVYTIDCGDEVLILQGPKKHCSADTLVGQHQQSITSKGIPTEGTFLQDHCYAQLEWQVDSLS